MSGSTTDSFINIHIDRKPANVVDTERVPLSNIGIHLASNDEGKPVTLIDSDHVTINVPSMVAPIAPISSNEN